MSDNSSTKSVKSAIHKIEWSDSFLLANTEGLSKGQRYDISRIDAHHKRLVRIIGALYSGMQPGKYDAEGIKGVMKDLTDFVFIHLTFEEGIMAYYEYEGFDEHKAIHDNIRHKVNGFIEQARNGAVVYVAIYQFLENWLLDHIANGDRAFIDWLVQHNAERESLQGLDPQLLAAMGVDEQKG